MDATHEEWRPVVGYENSYEVSNQGRIKRLAWIKTLSTGKTMRYKAFICAVAVKEYGHRSVKLRAPGERQAINKAIHRAVLEAFVSACPPGMIACHNDGDPSNNRVENLRWDTPHENNMDMLRHDSHFYGKRDRCMRDHPYTPENTRTRRSGIGTQWRWCKTCERERRTKSPTKKDVTR